MPHLVMLDFQITTGPLPTRSTFTALVNETWKLEEEMEIDLWVKLGQKLKK
jgi:hypothetical protein